MVTITSTTLAAAVTATSRVVYLTATTGLAIKDTIFVDQEGMTVQKIDGTKIDVIRGTGGSKVSAHASGETVYYGPPDYFYMADPVGAQAVDPPVTPWINLTTGAVFTVSGGEWVKSQGNVVTDVSTNATGALPVTNGGTGATTLVGARIPTTGQAAYIKTTNGVQTLAAAATGARNVVIIATVTQAFADGGGTQPTFKIGETDTDDKFAATSVFTNAALGTTFIRQGTLSSTKALLVTAAQAGGAGTGALTVSYFFVASA